MDEKTEKQKSTGLNWKLEVRVLSTRKLHENSTWSQLTPEQLEVLDEWLFDENLTYAKTVERVKNEFGIETTIPSAARYYRRRAQERHAEQLVEAQLAADGLNSMPVDANSLRTAALKLVGKAALNVAGEKPEEIKQLAALTELLLLAEQNDLRRGRLEFVERCFDYEATVATLDEFPQVRAFLQSVQDDTKLNDDEKMKKVHAMLYCWERSVKQLKKKFSHGK